MAERTGVSAPEQAFDHPLWWMLGGSWPRSDDPSPGREPVTWSPGGDDRDWRRSLVSRLARAEAGETILVAVERPLASAVLGLLSRGRWRRRHAPSKGRVERELRDASVRIEGRFALWPSAGAPRIAVPITEPVMMRWIQRSGVLGGGGRRLAARALARSRLFTPLTRLLAPGIALVGTKERDESR